MASYGSYKKIVQGQIIDGTVPNLALEDGAGLAYNVKAYLWVNLMFAHLVAAVSGQFLLV